jgi:hypothetical protein
MPDIAKYVEQEIQVLSQFIYDDCIDEPVYEEKMRYAVKKTIEGIVASLALAHETELSRVKEQYSQKLIEGQQKILDRFSAVIDKIIQ